MRKNVHACYWDRKPRAIPYEPLYWRAIYASGRKMRHWETFGAYSEKSMSRSMHRCGHRYQLMLVNGQLVTVTSKHHLTSTPT